MKILKPDKSSPIKGAKILDAMPALKRRAWSVADSIALYKMDRWGLGYFSGNERGEVTCNPRRQSHPVSLLEIAEEAKEKGLSFPLQIRFQDLLQERVKRVHQAFDRAIGSAGYENDYQGIYPVKVNQLREVVEEILEAGRDYQLGLEVGSKAELVAALAINDNGERPIICNGYKDDTFIRLALQAQRLGRTIIIVIEKLDEVDRIIRLSHELKVCPQLGIRMRLYSRGSGKWSDSSGECAKFGLNASEALTAWERLQSHGLASAFKMIHFHIGSQIPDIRSFQAATREATRYYAKFVHLGAPLEYLDVGGGLAVDYDGTASSQASSKNYSVEEYASTIVNCVRDICNEERVSHPGLLSESGRFIVAPHAVLLVEAFANVEKGRGERLLQIQSLDAEHRLVRDILGLLSEIEAGRDLVRSYHQLHHIREEALSLFDVGMMDLETRAKVEDLYWHVAGMIVHRCEQQGSVPAEITQLAADLGSQYVCNFSIFQSLLDNWAIDQLFPIVPIHRLNEKPEYVASLVDITCDSEGKMEASGAGVSVHAIGDEPYYLGIFLTGAYQDIMGDHHNLFGRVNEIHVYADANEDKGYYIEEVMRGSSIDEVLQDTQYDTQDLVRRFKAQVDQAIRSGQLRSSSGMDLLHEYKQALAGYTYLS